MTNTARRTFIAGAFAVPAAAAPIPFAVLDPIKVAADRLAAAMAARHGGRWVTHVDHDAGFILVRHVLRREG
jgi:hypothetical protein